MHYIRLLIITLAMLSPASALAIYQTLPTSPPLRVSGYQIASTDLIVGLKIPDGPVIGPVGSVNRYGPPTGYTLLASRTNTILVNGANVGTLYDYVFRDTADNTLVLALRVILAPVVNGAQNTFEINDFFRRGNTNFTVQAAWSRGADADLRMYAAVRTAVKFGQGTETFDPDTVKFQSDINVSEGNPWSGYFFLKTNAPNYRVAQNGLSVYQGGEEGQPLVEVFFDGFVPSDFPDNDGDGYDSSVDCNDNDPNINPGAPEICDGIDNNCNGLIDEGDVCVLPKKVPAMGLVPLALLFAVIAALGAWRLSRKS